MSLVIRNSTTREEVNQFLPWFLRIQLGVQHATHPPHPALQYHVIVPYTSDLQPFLDEQSLTNFLGNDFASPCVGQSYWDSVISESLPTVLVPPSRLGGNNHHPRNSQ